MVNLSPTFRLAAAMISASMVITSSVHAAKINIKNHCLYDITACDEDQTNRVTCYVLKGSGNAQVEIDVGATWNGIIWGLPSSFGDGSLGYQAKDQANIAEFVIGAASADYYDLSNVNGYSLPLMINSTFTDKSCPSINCTISDLSSFCQPPNLLIGGPGFACKNAEGNGSINTTGTRAFSSRCPAAYSYTKDDTTAIIGICETGSNYDLSSALDCRGFGHGDGHGHLLICGTETKEFPGSKLDPRDSCEKSMLTANA